MDANKAVIQSALLDVAFRSVPIESPSLRRAVHSTLRGRSAAASLAMQH
jgi:hypothetical protein